MKHRPSTLVATNVLVGIDDTDNLTSPGTGRMAQHLAQTFHELGAATPLGATRHQLLVDDRIPYTSHNSSACIALDAGPDPDVAAIIDLAAGFLEGMGAPGSDPGLAVATTTGWQRPEDRGRLSEYGFRAKREVLDQASARALAGDVGIHLSPHGGDGGGIIGALAAIGLHCSGADGLFLWMPRIRGLIGETTYAALRDEVPIDAALDPYGREPDPADSIELGDWVRPVFQDGRAVLLLEPAILTTDADDSLEVQTRWRVAPRAVVKTH